MGFVAAGLKEALQYIISLDPEVVAITLTSIKMSLASLAVSSVIGLPAGILMAAGEYRGKKLAISAVNTMMSMPTVLIGLLVYSFISRRGPLGGLDLLFTPSAVIIGQAILALPIIISLSITATGGLDGRVFKTASSLGAGKLHSFFMMISEARYAYYSAVAAGGARVLSEVGVSMMLGGNIRGYTRNIPTAIALETSKGEFARSIALGLILLVIAFAVNLMLHYFKSLGPEKNA